MYTSAHSSPVDKNTFSDSNHLSVVSPLGKLTGDTTEMSLCVSSNIGNVNAQIIPVAEFYAGATGLLNFLGDSYEYAYPNMKVTGTITIAEKMHNFENAIAWFDRQYSEINTSAANMNIAKTPKDFSMAWLWIGMAINNNNNGIMITDVYESGKRNAFATIAHENGTHVNTLIDVTYENIWQSDKTGSKYPNKISVVVPYENLELTFISLANNEFTHRDNGTHGCQVLCEVTGKHKKTQFKKLQIVEIVGNLCG